MKNSISKKGEPELVNNFTYIAKMAAGELRQAQKGPLNIEISNVVTLSQETRFASDRRQSIPHPFTGSLTIKNNGNHLITFKILSIGGHKCTATPSNGLLRSEERLSVNVSAKVSPNDMASSKLGILILSTACEVDDCDSVLLDFSSLWKQIVREGSTSYVEISLIKRFNFFYSGMITQVVNYEHEWSDSSGSGTGSSSSFYQTGSDSNGSGDTNLGRRTRMYKGILVEVTSRSQENIARRVHTLPRRNVMATLFIIIIIFAAFQMFFKKWEYNVLFRK